MKKAMNIFLFVLGGIPLIAYPFVMIANLMQIAGDYSDQSLWSIVWIIIFIAITTSYPITYILCLIFYFSKKRKKIYFPVLPLLQIIVAVFLFNIGQLFEKH